MTTVAAAQSGKTARDENFPVASWLIDSRRRPAILAFYGFVRAADDVADNPSLSAEEKLALLDRLEDGLEGRVEEQAAEPLRRALRERELGPRHALDLLKAFRLDATKRRYADFAELIDYCRLSAMPVGRFVLDVHSESRSLWPASDALCAALQVINHLQDCGDDYRRLNRVYLPLRILGAHGARPEMLAADRASPALRDAIGEIADHAAALVDQGAALIPRIANPRLAAEIGAIHALAERLARRLQRADPLSERVRFAKTEFFRVASLGAARGAAAWLLPSWPTLRRLAP